MKINCLTCGHTVDLDDAYAEYEGIIRCFVCSALLEVRIQEGNIKSVKVVESIHEPVGASAGERMS